MNTVAVTAAVHNTVRGPEIGGLDVLPPGVNGRWLHTRDNVVEETGSVGAGHHSRPGSKAVLLGLGALLVLGASFAVTYAVSGEPTSQRVGLSNGDLALSKPKTTLKAKEHGDDEAPPGWQSTGTEPFRIGIGSSPSPPSSPTLSSVSPSGSPSAAAERHSGDRLKARSRAAPNGVLQPTHDGRPSTTKTLSAVERSVTVRKTPKSEQLQQKKKAAKKRVIYVTANTAYRLHNVATGKCATGSDGTIRQYTCTASDQKWKLQRTRVVGGVQLYWIRRTSDTKLCFDLPWYTTNDEDTYFSMYDCRKPVSQDNQEFQLRRANRVSHGHEEYALVNYENEMCVDVDGRAADGGDAGDGQALKLYRCTTKADGWDDHLWTFR